MTTEPDDAVMAQAETDETSPLECRYFIGVTPGTGWRTSVKAGPARFKRPAHPWLMGETEMFPVSRAVWEEWSGDDEDDDGDSDGGAMPTGEEFLRRFADPNLAGPGD